MKAEILSRPAKVLGVSEREHYYSQGYLSVSDLVDQKWLQRLRVVTDEFVELSRTIKGRDGRFDLEPDHSAELPRIRRLNSPVELHEEYWRFASTGPFADVAEDLLGPDFKFHHSKLNFKWGGGGEEVKWHQDIQFWPHTNYDLITIGVYLKDVVHGQGEMGFIPKSHAGDLFDQYEGDRWVGYIQDRDLPKVDTNGAVFPVGKAGTVTIHNCRTIHGSYPNDSASQRPLLLQTYTAADAFAYTDLVRRSPHGEELIRGNPARWARHDPRPCQVPPTKIGTIFQAQQKEM